jgi:hypothetical protein
MLMGQAMPPGLPSLKIDWYKDTTLCDYIFLSTERFVLPVTVSSGGMIFDKHGELVWYLPADDNLYNFSPQPNGKISFNLNDTWFELDSNFALTTVSTCAGIAGDFHDFIHFADGRTMELCNSDTILDLRGLYTYSGQEGDSAATVRYNIVEERNAAGLLLKRWRGIDHFAPADVDSQYFFYPWYLELNHTNSMDYDGRYLMLSHRSNHEVTLVDWPTGQVAWRLGGPNNDFTFLNDGGFKSQHDARFAGPGRITIMDNRSLGMIRTPRAVAYVLDTVNWIATKEYEWVEQNSESPSMGSYRELPNGDGIISWGQILPEDRPNISYYQPNGQKVCDWQFQDQHMVYRVTCGDLDFALERPEIVCNQQNGILVLNVTSSHSSYLWSNGDTASIIQALDTGYYQVYVPMGVGFVGSNVIHVTDVNAACPSTPVVDPVPGGRPPRIAGTYDLLGRPVEQRLPGHVYIERYSNGLSRKVIQY